MADRIFYTLAQLRAACRKNGYQISTRGEITISDGSSLNAVYAKDQEGIDAAMADVQGKFGTAIYEDQDVKTKTRKQKSTNIFIDLQRIDRVHHERSNEPGKLSEKIIDSTIVKAFVSTRSRDIYFKIKINDEYQGGAFNNFEEDLGFNNGFALVTKLGDSLEIEAYRVPGLFTEALYIGKASFTASEASLQDGLQLENVTQKVTTEYKEFSR